VGSGANMPYGTRCTGFGAAVSEEEEEGVLEEMEHLRGDAFSEEELAVRLHTATGLSTATTTTEISTSSGGGLPSTTFITPDLGTTGMGPASETAAMVFHDADSGHSPPDE
jgi:hypothetical protein